jgi:MFS family permease
MSKKQIFTLFLCSLIYWIAGNGLLPLLPVYASQLGATPSVIGSYLSIVYIGLAMGAIIVGWLSDKFQRRKIMLIINGLLAVPVCWLMGRVTNIWYLTALTSGLWFLGGVALTLLSILTGLFAEKTKRGKYFGILMMAAPLGSLIGGLMTGPIADRWGYPILFSFISIFMILFPLIALLIEDKDVLPARSQMAKNVGKKTQLGSGFIFLFISSIIIFTIPFLGQLGRSLSMNKLGFSAAAISRTAAIGGAVALPMPLVIGWLSDRIERKRCLALIYIAGTVSLIILSASVSLWHFCISISLLSVLMQTSRAVGSALVTDIVPPASLGRGISLFTATTWIGGIIGFAVTGFAVQNLGMFFTLIIGACLPIAAMVLLIPIGQPEKEESIAGEVA